MVLSQAAKVPERWERIQVGEVTGKWSSLPIGTNKNRVPDSRSQILIPGDDICQIEFHAQSP